MKHQFLRACIVVLVLLVIYLLSIEKECAVTPTEEKSAILIDPQVPFTQQPSIGLEPTKKPTSQPTLQPNSQPTSQATNPLACAKPIQDYIATHGESFDPAVRDLITFTAEYALVDTLQAKFYQKINSQTFHFTDANALKERINRLGKCQSTSYSSKEPSPLPRLAICSYQSSTAQYVQEWLVHYILHGVSKFFIYNNNKDTAAYDALQRAVEPFEQLGIVEIFVHKGKIQQDGVNDCMRRAEGFDWVSFLDADEYITFNNEYNCIPEFLYKYAEEHKDKPMGTIAMRWRNMVTDGAPMHNTSKTLYEQEHYEPLPHKFTKKHIAYVKGTKSYVNIHEVVPKAGFYMYDTNGNILTDSGPFFKDPATGVGVEIYKNIELRHFWGFSLEYLMYDKLCGSLPERKSFMDRRIGMAFKNFEKDTVKVKMAPHKHEVALNEFLFGS